MSDTSIFLFLYFGITTVLKIYISASISPILLTKTSSIPSGKTKQGMDVHQGRLYLAVQQKLYYRDKDKWVETSIKNVAALQTSKEELYIIPTNRNGIAKIDSTYQITWMLPDNRYHAIAKDGDTYWLGSHTDGLVRYDIQQQLRESFYPE